MKFIIAIDLGGTNLKIALLDEQYKIRYKAVSSIKKLAPRRAAGTSFKQKENLISAISGSINQIIKERHLKKVNILGVGLGLPGPIDVKRGIVHFFPNIPGWKEVNLKNILRQKLGLPIFLDNDANLMALAESRLGAARTFSNAVCLTLGTGVGGGVIIEGNLYRGSNFSAGEVGHIPINEEGPGCNCGSKACLEVYVGNARILRQAKKIFKRAISLEELSLLAKRKNKKAQEIWLGVARRLGIALSGVVNLLNPDVIVLGGGVAAAGKILFSEIRETILQRAMSVQARHVRVFPARLGNDAGLIGAGILAKESLKK